ncbi:MAG: histidine kinase N-terminal 7TM domain-containing protein, partial [Anaerolineae bacterium]
MDWHLIVSEAMLAVAAAVMLTLAFLVHRRRTGIGSRQFLLLALTTAEWALASTLEVASPGLEAKITYAKIEYVGIALAPLAWYLFATHYANRRTSTLAQAILWVLPAITISLAFTNEAHHLVWTNVWLRDVGGVPAFAARYGAWFWVHLLYSYGLLFHGGLFLARAQLRLHRPFTGQAATLLVALAAPWLANAFYILGLTSVIPFDITPLAFTVTGVAIGISLIRYQLLEVVPVARERSFESMEDAVIVLDPRDRVVDLNRSAAAILGRPQADVLGLPADTALGAVPLLLHCIVSGCETTEIAVDSSPGARHYDVRVTSLTDRGGSATGRLVVLRDTTSRARAEQARSAIYAMSEAVHTVSDLQELYRAIHMAISRLMPATNCYIATYHQASDTVSYPYLVDEAARQPLPRTAGAGMTEYILRSGAPLLADRQRLLSLVESGDIDWPDSESLPHSYLGVPLVDTRGTIGVLAIQSYNRDVAYTHHDLEMLRFVSEQIAMAISRREAEDELRAAREALEERVEQRTAELAEANAALRTREERYRLLFDGTSDAVLVHEL